MASVTCSNHCRADLARLAARTRRPYADLGPIAVLAVLGALAHYYRPAWLPHPHHTLHWADLLPIIALGVGATRWLHERRQLAALAERLHDVPPPISPEVAHMRARGKKAQAIKRYRELNPGTRGYCTEHRQLNSHTTRAQNEPQVAEGQMTRRNTA